MKQGNTFLRGVLAVTSLCFYVSPAAGAIVELTQVSNPIGIVDQTSAEETGTEVSSLEAPEEGIGYHFIEWRLGGIRQEDALGRALHSFSFTILEPTTITAHYLPSDQDSDTDGIEDWYEWEFFGNLDSVATDDADGDGFDLFEEKLRGYHPKIYDVVDEGGVSRRQASSGLLILNPAFVVLKQISAPTGFVDTKQAVAKDSTIDTMNLLGATILGYRFAYWSLGGIVQSESSGRAIASLSLLMDESKTAVAVYVPEDQDSDFDSLPDWYEWNHFSDLDEGAGSDPDNDGWDIAEELLRGYDPLVADTIEEGGISRRLSSGSATVNLQPFERMEYIPLAGRLARLFTFDTETLTGFDFGNNTSTVLG